MYRIEQKYLLLMTGVSRVPVNTLLTFIPRVITSSFRTTTTDVVLSAPPSPATTLRAPRCTELSWSSGSFTSALDDTTIRGCCCVVVAIDVAVTGTVTSWYRTGDTVNTVGVAVDNSAVTEGGGGTTVGGFVLLWSRRRLLFSLSSRRTRPISAELIW